MRTEVEVIERPHCDLHEHTDCSEKRDNSSDSRLHAPRFWPFRHANEFIVSTPRETRKAQISNVTATRRPGSSAACRLCYPLEFADLP
jgi:hypothetical protein